MSAHPQTARTMVFVLFGPLVWGLHMTLSYAGHASLCEAGERLPLVGRTWLPWILVAVTVLALVALAWGVLKPGSLRAALGLEQREIAFLGDVMRLLTVLSIIGVAAAAVAMIVLPTCLQLR